MTIKEGPGPMTASCSYRVLSDRAKAMEMKDQVGTLTASCQDNDTATFIGSYGCTRVSHPRDFSPKNEPRKLYFYCF